MGEGRSWKKSKQWASWTGDRSDLLLLLADVQDVSERRREDFVAHATRFEKRSVAELDAECSCDDGTATEWHREEHARARSSLAARHAEAMAKPSLSVTVANRDNTVETASGAPEEVLRTVDERLSVSVSVVGVSFDFSSRLVVLMSKRSGVELVVESPHIEWAKAAFVDLSRTIERGTRRAWLRRDPVYSVLVGLLSWPVFYGLVTLLFSMAERGEAPSQAWFLAVALGLACGMAGLGGALVRRFLLPGFEIAKDGHPVPSSARGRLILSAVAYVAALVIPFLLGR